MCAPLPRAERTQDGRPLVAWEGLGGRPSGDTPNAARVFGWVVRMDPLRPTLQPEGGYSLGWCGGGQRPPHQVPGPQLRTRGAPRLNFPREGLTRVSPSPVCTEPRAGPFPHAHPGRSCPCTSPSPGPPVAPHCWEGPQPSTWLSPPGGSFRKLPPLHPWVGWGPALPLSGQMLLLRMTRGIQV